MRRRSSLTLLVLAILALAAAFWPSPTFACQVVDPGCFIDDFVHKQLYQLNLSIWQINRAGLRRMALVSTAPPPDGAR